MPYLEPSDTGSAARIRSLLGSLRPPKPVPLEPAPAIAPEYDPASAGMAPSSGGIFSDGVPSGKSLLATAPGQAMTGTPDEFASSDLRAQRRSKPVAKPKPAVSQRYRTAGLD